MGSSLPGPWGKSGLTMTRLLPVFLMAIEAGAGFSSVSERADAGSSAAVSSAVTFSAAASLAAISSAIASSTLMVNLGDLTGVTGTWVTTGLATVALGDAKGTWVTSGLVTTAQVVSTTAGDKRAG